MTPLPLSLGCRTVALGMVAASVSQLHNWSLKVVEQSCQVSSRVSGYLGNCTGEHNHKLFWQIIYSIYLVQLSDCC